MTFAEPPLILNPRPCRSVASIAPPVRRWVTPTKPGEVPAGTPASPPASVPPAPSLPATVDQTSSLPATSVLPRSEPAATAGTTARTAERPAARAVAVPARRSETRRPFHVPVMVGVGAGLYACSLAATSVWQIAADRHAIADRTPVSEAIAALRAHHDTMTSSLQGATDRYVRAVTDYQALTDGATELHGRMAGLAAELRRIDSIRLVLPQAAGGAVGGTTSGGRTSGGTTSGVTARGAVGGSGSFTSSSSSGSGGGSSSGGGSVAVSAPVAVAPAAVAPAPPPPPAAPPPTNATTGASGKP